MQRAVTPEPLSCCCCNLTLSAALAPSHGMTLGPDRLRICPFVSSVQRSAACSHLSEVRSEVTSQIRPSGSAVISRSEATQSDSASSSSCLSFPISFLNM
ncbi:hypothetical protein XENORESO_002895 [Xenotaenia resolanae]|uniref:Secreted protein n=1 Tax=Xenotaenia resolanae TaxID=208358 RepID=A0ABV0WT68_9TELE